MHRALTTPRPRPIGSTAVERISVGRLDLDVLAVRRLDVLHKA